MRIWAFPSFYPYDYPGFKWSGIFAHRQYKGLVDSGAELCVILPVMWHPVYPLSSIHPEWKQLQKLSYPKERVYDGIKIYHPRVSNFKPNRFVKKSYSERYAESIINFFKDNKIKLNPSTDIFYSQWIPDAAFVQIAAKELGIKSAVLAVGDDVIIWPNSKKENLEIFRQTIVNADIRLAVAGYLGNEANRLIGSNLPFEIVRRGVNYDFFKPGTNDEKQKIRKELGIPNDKIVILCIGSAIVRKGWLDIFEALQEIKKTNKNFMLVGISGGEAAIDLDEAAKKYGLESFFLNLGEVEPSKIANFYHCADIFCLPSHWEGIANAVVEGMSSGLAVVTTNVSGHPELVTDGITGILVPAKQPQILSEKLKELINNEHLREVLGKNAREFIVNKWGNFAHNAALLYKKLDEALLK